MDEQNRGTTIHQDIKQPPVIVPGVRVASLVSHKEDSQLSTLSTFITPSPYSCDPLCIQRPTERIATSNLIQRVDLKTPISTHHQLANTTMAEEANVKAVQVKLVLLGE